MTQPLPLTYTDLVCTDDVDPMATETTSDLQNLEQDVFHVLLEALGSNLDDLTRGVNVAAALSGPSQALDRLASRIDQQLGQDDRIDTSHSTVTQASDGSYRIEIEIAVAGTTLGLSFAFTATGGLQIL